jgi:excisionase family DNA binding protein
VTPPTLLSIEEVARRLRVSRRTVERLIASGQVRTVAIGRRRLIEAKEVDAYVAANRQVA